MRVRNRQTEVGEAHPAPAVQHDVRGFEIAVEHTGRMCGREPGTELARDVDRLVFGQAADAPEERREVLPIHVFHREEVVPLELPDIEDAADVRVRHLPGRADLPVKPGQRGGVAQERLRQKLQGDRLIELEVVGAIDLTHPACAEKPRDSIAPGDDGPGREPFAPGRPHDRGSRSVAGTRDAVPIGHWGRLWHRRADPWSQVRTAPE